MNFGCFSFFKIEKQCKEITDKLIGLCEDDKCVKYRINASFFYGGYVSNNSIKTSSDFFFSNETNGDWVLFSGNIYNKEKINRLYSLSIDYEPDLIYHLYKKLEIGFVDILNGCFSIILFDSILNTLFIFRDHIGLHPITWIYLNEIIYFSSDPICISSVFHNSEIIDSEFLLSSFKIVDYNKLPNAKVNKLLPGHFLKFSRDGISINKYWFPEKIKNDKSLSRSYVLKKVTDLLVEAVKIRSDLELKAAAHISSGLDSGIVAALSRNEYQKQNLYLGFSWSPNHEIPVSILFDERNLVLEQCKLNNIQPYFVSLDETDYLKYSSNIIKYCFNYEENKIMDEAQRQNIELIFSGYGGDEFFSIGNEGIDIDLFLKFEWKIFFQRYPINNIKALIKVFIYEILFPFFKIIPFNVRKYIRINSKYLKIHFKKPYKNFLGKLYFYKSRNDHHLGLLYRYHLTSRIEDWFLKSYKKGIEYVYPLLDKDLVEFILTIPSKHMVSGIYSRSLPREIGENLLPESIRWKKSGLDPVHHYNAKKNILNSSKKLIFKIEEMKDNPNLGFIDFEKLNADIDKFKNNANANDFEDLMYAIFKIYELHSFTLAYKVCYINESLK